MKQLLPLATDEAIAIIVLLITFLPVGIAALGDIQNLAIIYLFICAAFRKYEAIRQKHP